MDIINGKAIVEAKNHGEALAHTVEKNLEEHGAALGAEEKSQIEQDLSALRKAMEGDNADAITDKTNALAQSSMKLGEAVYKAQQEAPASASGDTESDGASSGAAGGESVVDAEYEEVDEDKKK